MSQIHQAFTAGTIGAILHLTGNVGGPVNPDAGHNINIVGADPITVTGNPGLNTLTISIATATTAQIGATTLATDAETIGGIVTDHAVTPTSLKAKLGAQTANAIPYGNGTGNAINWLGPLTNGQLIIGSTGAAPVAAGLTAGNNIGIGIGAGFITVNVNGTTDHAVQVGNVINSLTSLAVGTDGQVLIGATGANPAFATLTSIDGTITYTPGANTLDLSAASANVLQDQIYYVGKHGNDLNTGRNIEAAVLTFGQAIVLATAALPTAVNRFAIVCLDDGIYAEAITVPQYVDVFAPNATLTGTIIVNDDSSIKFSRLNVADATIGVLKAAGTVYTNVDIDYVTCDLSGIGMIGLAGFINCHWKEMYVADGIGIGDTASAQAHMHLFGGDIYISGTGIAVARANTGSTVGHVDHIADIGAGVGTGIAVFDGTVDINVNTLDNDVAYNVDGATSVLRLFANSITGTRTVANGGTDYHWVPPLAMANGQLVIGAGVGVDPVVANITSTDASVSITNGAGSIDLSVPGSGMTWSREAGAAVPVVNNHGYINTNVGLTTFTLPAVCAVGDEFAIMGESAAGWTIAQNAGQNIQIGAVSTTGGIGGSLASSNRYDGVHLICRVANTTWQNVESPQGNLTIV